MMYRSSNLIDERKYFLKNSKNIFLNYALYDAVLDCDLQTVEFLLTKKHVNPNHVLEEYDSTPLHTATGIGTEEISLRLVRLLLSSDADPNIQTSDGTTPLMICCLFGRMNVIELLINNGANPFIEDIDNKNSYHYAFQSGHDIICNLLEELTQRYIQSYYQKSFDECEITSEQYKNLYSDIESDVNCAEFYILNTGFIDESEDSSSDNDDRGKIEFLSAIKTFPIEENILKGEVEKKCLSSSSSQVSAISCTTDVVKDELKKNNINHGPVTKTTKKVYYNLLKKFKKGKATLPFADDEFSNYPEIIRSTLVDQVEYQILKWTHLEMLMSNNFSRERIHWRGGKEKQFFTYLLLDPFISNNLPSRQSTLNELNLWKIFLLSIFYIGKGKNSRPFSHFYEALRRKQKSVSNQKVSRIRKIWSQHSGIICVHIFHNIISAEAHTREAAMIDSLGCNNLTNMQYGEYHGVVKNWCIKEKRQLGLVLLHKALKIYLAEGERQIFPSDLPPLNF